MPDRFCEILDELKALHNRKSADYGTGEDPYANVRASEAWGIPSWVGSMIRGCDKIKRLQSFAANGRLANEGVEDAFKDLAVYAVIGLVLYEEREGIIMRTAEELGKSAAETVRMLERNAYDTTVAGCSTTRGGGFSLGDSVAGLPDATGFSSEQEAVRALLCREKTMVRSQG